jgi:hypothetical protein
MSFDQKTKSFLFKAFIFILFSFTLWATYAQNKPELKFNADGEFKIVQFTDIHFSIQNKERCDSVLTMMSSIISSEKPGLVILTGDIVTSADVNAAWSEVTSPIRKAGIPWAVAFGNHDHEQGVSNKQIMEYLVTLPLNLSENGPADIHGSGNYILKIQGSDKKETKALIYCFDSNAYPWEKDNPELGDYDWIKFDQIKWYREQSKMFTAKNNNKPLPALAFFHIPLPEYNSIKTFPTTIGDRDEEVCSPKINSGMYNAILESGDVMGTFCGHDHNNNYIGTLNNIALVYGCKTGKDSYGDYDKGGRVIVLHEGVREFDTWIHTTEDAKKYFAEYPNDFKK